MNSIYDLSAANGKSALGSGTLQGILVAALPAIDTALVNLGYTQAPVLTPLLATSLSAFGLIYAFIKRIRAKQQITSVLPQSQG